MWSLFISCVKVTVINSTLSLGDTSILIRYISIDWAHVIFDHFLESVLRTLSLMERPSPSLRGDSGKEPTVGPKEGVLELWAGQAAYEEACTESPAASGAGF